MNKFIKFIEQSANLFTLLFTKYRENGKVKVAGPTRKYHKVKSGDTIERIARKYGVPQSRIFELNKINSKTIIRPGQSIRYQ